MKKQNKKTKNLSEIFTRQQEKYIQYEVKKAVLGGYPKYKKNTYKFIP